MFVAIRRGAMIPANVLKPPNSMELGKPRIQEMLEEVQEVLDQRKLDLANDPNNFAYQLSVRSWTSRVEELTGLYNEWRQKAGL